MEKIDPYTLPRQIMLGKDTKRNSVFPEVEGVYFIFGKKKLLYIGRSHSIRNRLAAHCSNDYFKPYMMAAYIETHQSTELEKQYIDIYYPPLNDIMSNGTEYSSNKSVSRSELVLDTYLIKCKMSRKEPTAKDYEEYLERMKNITVSHWEWIT